MTKFEELKKKLEYCLKSSDPLQALRDAHDVLISVALETNMPEKEREILVNLYLDLKIRS